MNFIVLYNEYLDFKSLNLKFQSYRKIKSVFNNHILPFFKDYDINNINSHVYLNWLKYIDENEFSNKYNKIIYFCISDLFEFAIKMDYLCVNIPKKIGFIKKRKYEKPKNNFFNKDEIEKFLSVIDDYNYYVLFYTLISTGLRIGECLALTWYDYNNCSLTINKTMSKEKKNGEYVINSPKTQSSYRTIKIDDFLVSSLEKIKLEQSKHDFFNNSWYIFGGSKPFSQTTICRRKDIYCNLANVKKIRLHDLRHTCATLLLQNNIPITDISYRLGHSDCYTTLKTYAHVNSKDENQTIDLFNNLCLFKH